MKIYKTILLDADDTIFDFAACEGEAIRLAFESFGFQINEEIRKAYAKINEDLWKQYEKGIIDKDTVIHQRFRILFDRFEIKGNKDGFEEAYQELLGMQHIMIDDAIQVIEYLYEKYDLYIVTNGVTNTQLRRIHESGIEGYMKRIFVSEETGFQKPMKEYFDYCFERIDNANRDQAMIIGDSLSSDIKGGNNAGITACWYNPKALINTSDSTVDIEINHLSDLYKLL
ncbi:MAG: noncanonical pyrimidine nucleotidase, YjjG family [Clostridiales bacterium]|jgi:2-haloacid dehalogenase|nr:noncanonical pyrimidine nucleotidase, YjjG family [Clostridiales bacterium]